jgi:hypothetical protein
MSIFRRIEPYRFVAWLCSTTAHDSFNLERRANLAPQPMTEKCFSADGDADGREIVLSGALLVEDGAEREFEGFEAELVSGGEEFFGAHALA